MQCHPSWSQTPQSCVHSAAHAKRCPAAWCPRLRSASSPGTRVSLTLCNKHQNRGWKARLRAAGGRQRQEGTKEEMRAPSPTSLASLYKRPWPGRAADRTRPHTVTHHGLHSAPLGTARSRSRLKHRGGASAGPAPAPASHLLPIYYYIYIFSICSGL